MFLRRCRQRTGLRGSRRNERRRLAVGVPGGDSHDGCAEPMQRSTPKFNTGSLPKLRFRSENCVRCGGVVAALALMCAAELLPAQSAPAVAHTFFRVEAADSVKEPVTRKAADVSEPVGRQRGEDQRVAPPAAPGMVAQQIEDLAPGMTLGACRHTGFSQPFSELAAGNYEVQAVLDDLRTKKLMWSRPSIPCQEAKPKIKTPAMHRMWCRQVSASAAS